MKQILDPKALRAKRALGQNFLCDEGYILRIIDALDLNGNDRIIEIGPGRGALTDYLVRKAGRVFAIEIDGDLVPLLEERFGDRTNFQLLVDDALTTDLGSLLSQDRGEPAGIDKGKLVANLPYYISTAILKRLAVQRHLFSSLVLMFQKEVAERITAPPGTKERGFLTVLVEAFFDTERLFDVPPAAFRPQPKVWSSVVRLMPKTLQLDDEEAFVTFVGSAFLQKRKTIQNNLKQRFPQAVQILGEAQIEATLRPEALDLQQWIRLSKYAK